MLPRISIVRPNGATPDNQLSLVIYAMYRPPSASEIVSILLMGHTFYLRVYHTIHRNNISHNKHTKMRYHLVSCASYIRLLRYIVIIRYVCVHGCNDVCSRVSAVYYGYRNPPLVLY